MAKFLNVSTDLADNAATTKGNRAGRYALEEAEINYGGVSHGFSLYVQNIYFFEDID